MTTLRTLTLASSFFLSILVEFSILGIKSFYLFIIEYCTIFYIAILWVWFYPFLNNLINLKKNAENLNKTRKEVKK